MKSEDGAAAQAAEKGSGAALGSKSGSSPLKATRRCETGPVLPAPVLEDEKVFPKNRLPVTAGNGAAACFYTREI